MHKSRARQTESSLNREILSKGAGKFVRYCYNETRLRRVETVRHCRLIAFKVVFKSVTSTLQRFFPAALN